MALTEKGFYDFQTVIVARINPKTKTVDILNAEGKADDKKYGVLHFEDKRLFAVGPHDPIASTVFLYPGEYAPILLHLFQPGVGAATLVNVQEQQTEAPSEFRKNLSKAFGGTPGLTDAVAKMEPKSLHGLRIGDQVNIWHIKAGQTLNLGSVKIENPVFEIDGVKCANSKDTYEWLIKNEQIKQAKGISGFLFNTPNKEATIDPEIQAAAKVCPSQKDFERRLEQVGSFQIRPVSTLP